jgi:hypothetical protein
MWIRLRQQNLQMEVNDESGGGIKKARRCELTNLLTLNLIHMKNRFVITTSMRFYLMLLSKSVAEVSCILM